MGQWAMPEKQPDYEKLKAPFIANVEDKK